MLEGGGGKEKVGRLLVFGLYIVHCVFFGEGAGSLLGLPPFVGPDVRRNTTLRRVGGPVDGDTLSKPPVVLPPESAQMMRLFLK